MTHEHQTIINEFTELLRLKTLGQPNAQVLVNGLTDNDTQAIGCLISVLRRREPRKPAPIGARVGRQYPKVVRA
jgi:hypothetical protein